MAKVTHLTLAKDGGLANQRVPLREIGDPAEAPLETIGQDFRSARLRRGEDLATVSRVLKIRQEHLEALEEDRLTALPGRTYAVGFVRAYAQYLGLDPLKMVERFKAEAAGRVEISRTAGFPEVPEEEGAPYGWVAIGVIVAGLIGYGGYYLMTAPEPLAKQPVAPVPAHILAKPRTQVAQAKPAPKIVSTAPPLTPSAGPQPSGPNNQAATQEPGSPVPPEQSTTPTVSPPVPQATGQVYGVQSQTTRVILRAKQATRILVQDASGRVYINRALEPGDVYQVPDRPGLLLTVQHGNAVEVDLDGQAMGLAGQTADIAEGMPLDPQAIADRYNGDAE